MPAPFKSQFDPPLSPEKERAVLNALERMEAEEELRQREQGLGVPIIGVSLEGNALVQVGDRRITATGCKTFHDFLLKYLWALLEVEWLLSEKEKPDNDQHWIVRWRLRAIEEQKAVPSPGLGSRRLMSGADLSLLKLAYNLYLIEHNSPSGEGYKRVCQFIRRLKNGTEGNFFGALFETHVSAMFLVAGFDVEYFDPAP